MQSFNMAQIEQNIIKQKSKLKKLSHNYKINFENIEKKILIDVDEIEKLTMQNKKPALIPIKINGNLLYRKKIGL